MRSCWDDSGDRQGCTGNFKVPDFVEIPIYIYKPYILGIYGYI